MRNLISKPVLFILMMFLSVSAFAQKVANYAVGTYGTSGYEHFSFWMKDGKRGEIAYSYGKDSKEVKAVYLGKGSYQGKSCFQIQFPDGYLMYVIPMGLGLKIVGPSKKYSKLFTWAYEGPVNGVGTFCNVCAQNEKEAMAVIKGYFNEVIKVSVNKN